MSASRCLCVMSKKWSKAWVIIPFLGGRIDIEAVDASYTVFSLRDPSRHDYVLLNTEPSGDTYEITQIDYRWEFR